MTCPGVSEILSQCTQLIRRDTVNALHCHSHVPGPGMTGLLALAHQVIQGTAEPWPVGNRKELSRDLVVGQTGDVRTFVGKLGVVTSDQITSLFEHFVVEIAFLSLLESID